VHYDKQSFVFFKMKKDDISYELSKSNLATSLENLDSSVPQEGESVDDIFARLSEVADTVDSEVNNVSSVVANILNGIESFVLYADEDPSLLEGDFSELLNKKSIEDCVAKPLKNLVLSVAELINDMEDYDYNFFDMVKGAQTECLSSLEKIKTLDKIVINELVENIIKFAYAVRYAVDSPK